MAPYFLFGLILAVAAYLLLRWFVGADPRQVRKLLLWASVAIGLLFFIGLLTLGRQLLFALLPLLLVWFLTRRPRQARAKAQRGPSPGGTSEVRTRILAMVLDHDSGEMSGEVLEGPFAGKSLNRLVNQDLLYLWRHCLEEDEESARLLESYLDRRLGENWRDEATAAWEKASQNAGAGSAGTGMTREEAYEILGLKPEAGEEEIRRAYRSMMRKYHPDQGGSDYLAAKINQAKSLLLGE